MFCQIFTLGVKAEAEISQFAADQTRLGWTAKNDTHREVGLTSRDIKYADTSEQVDLLS